MIDRNRALTSEDLIRRYDLESLKSNRKAIQNNKNGLDKTENILNNFILSVIKGVSNTENQVDGKITTWFYNYEPTLNIVPASNWTTDALKNSHLGDLFYNKNTGYVYMFDIVNEAYQWVRQTDESTIQAMAIANSNPDTSDGYRDIFVIEPTAPYKVGDIWFKEDGSIYRCNVARASGDFNDAEWIPSSEYSNDNYENDAKAIINDFKQTITTNYICKVLVKSTRDSIELSVESITGDYTGTLATLNSRITQINNSIMLEVNKKINATDITGAYLVLKINGDSSSGKLSADKIDITADKVLNLLAGNTINLTSRNIAILSDNFSVDKNGNLRANSAELNDATINGGTIILTSDELSSPKLTICRLNDNAKSCYSIDGTRVYSNESYSTFENGHSFGATKNGQIIFYTDIEEGKIVMHRGVDSSSSGDYWKYFEINLDASEPYFEFNNDNTSYNNTTIYGNKIKTQTIIAGNIDCGTTTLNSSGQVSISFNKTFDSVPKVVLTPKTTASGVIAPKVRSVSTTGFTAIIGGTGFSNIDCDWIAIGE